MNFYKYVSQKGDNSSLTIPRTDIQLTIFGILLFVAILYLP